MEIVMSYVLVLEETMSGWVKFDKEIERQDFSFSLRAYSPKWLNIFDPRCFRGVALLGSDQAACSVEGNLTFHMTGPEYRVETHSEVYGNLLFSGKKQYRMKGLWQSLITCPMTIQQAGHVIGKAEVQYREKPWRFLVESLRIVKEEEAFGQYA